MRRPPTLKTIEVFASVQAKACARANRRSSPAWPAATGAAASCDTKTAWRDGRETPVEAIVAEVLRLQGGLPAAWVCLTGGEPLAQDVRPLVQKYSQMKLRQQLGAR